MEICFPGLNDYICSLVFHNKSNIKKISFGKINLFFSPSYPSTRLCTAFISFDLLAYSVDCSTIELNIVYVLKFSKFHSETNYALSICVIIPEATDCQI